jgi:hypothetical protein
MDFHIPDYVQVTIDGHDATDYIISYRRHDDVCELGVTFDLSLSDQYPYEIDPYDSVTIKELYNSQEGYVLRGYCIEISKDFEESDIKIKGMDKSIRLVDYYIPEQLISNGETVDYWIQTIVGMAGLSVYFEATSDQIVEVDTPLGFQTAADALLKLERLAAYYAKYDSQNDYVKIFRLGSSEPVISITDPTQANRQLGTENTRNVVKVYGGFKYDLIDQTATQIFAKVKKTMPELLADKSAVIVSPVIRSQTYAYMVANRILAVVSSLDDEQLYVLPGFYPGVQVGETCYIEVNHANYDFAGNRLITSIEAVVEETGAITTIGVGKKCPRISIQLADPPIFITTTTDGVGVSWNGGDTFVLSNIGLSTPEELNAANIAVNQFGRSMVVTAAGLYRRWGTGGLWTQVFEKPDDPINDAMDDPPVLGESLELIKVVDEPTKAGTFHVLARGKSDDLRPRWWVYTTKNFGFSWTSDQVYVPTTVSGYQENDYAPSGRVYSVTVGDITCELDNKVYVIADGGPILPPELIYWISYFSSGNIGIGIWKYEEEPLIKTALTWPTTTETFRYADVYSLPTYRDIAFVVLLTQRKAYPGNPVVRIMKTHDAGETWTKIFDQELTQPVWTISPLIPSHVIFNYSTSSPGNIEFIIPVWSNADAGSSYFDGVYTWVRKFYVGSYHIYGSYSSLSSSSLGPIENSEAIWQTSTPLGIGYIGDLVVNPRRYKHYSELRVQFFIPPDPVGGPYPTPLYKKEDFTDEYSSADSYLKDAIFDAPAGQVVYYPPNNSMAYSYGHYYGITYDDTLAFMYLNESSPGIVSSFTNLMGYGPTPKNFGGHIIYKFDVGDSQ